MPNLVNDFEVRKETLRKLGGNPTGLANIYEVDIEILKRIGGGGGEGIPDAPWDGVQYARKDGNWVPVEGGSGVDWDTIKQKLVEEGVDAIKFTKNQTLTQQRNIGFSDGAEPFYTGHTITPYTKVQMGFRCRRGTDNAFIGMKMNDAGDSGDKWRFCMLGGNSAFMQICDGYGEYRASVGDISTSTWYEFELGNCYIKDLKTGEIIAQGDANDQLYPWTELVLNACPGENGNIEWVKVFEGDELVRDYVAVEDENGNKGFYDRVAQTFTIAEGWQFSTSMTDPEIFTVSDEVILTVDELKSILKSVKSDTVTEIWTGTQEEYNALDWHFENVLYIITQN